MKRAGLELEAAPLGRRRRALADDGEAAPVDLPRDVHREEDDEQGLADVREEEGGEAVRREGLDEERAPDPDDAHEEDERVPQRGAGQRRELAREPRRGRLEARGAGGGGRRGRRRRRTRRRRPSRDARART